MEARQLKEGGDLKINEQTLRSAVWWSANLHRSRQRWSLQLIEHRNKGVTTKLYKIHLYKHIGRSGREY